MKKLLIIGAGNVGAYLTNNIADFPSFEIIGFLDDDRTKWGKSIAGYKILGSVDLIENLNETGLCVAICIHSPRVKQLLVQRLRDYDLENPNFISPYAWVSKGCTFGKGIIVYPGVAINYECEIGDFVNMNMNCAIGHNSTIQSYSSLAPGVNLGGFTFVEEGVDLGIGSSTLQNVNIGEYSIVGGQSMVIRDVPPNSKVKGVPAKFL